MQLVKQLAYNFLCLFWGKTGLPRTINGYELRLPVRYFRYFQEDYEADNIRFLQSHVAPGAVVLDVGAHIGLFSVIAAKCVGHGGHVVAYEPTPSTFRLLKHTIRINQLLDVVIPVTAAVGHETGEINFYVSDNAADNSNSLVAYKTDRKLYSVTVPLTTIDQEVKQRGLSRVDFIKIDVEGAEYDTLRGAYETLVKFKPRVIFAIHPDAIAGKGDSLHAILEELHRLPYTFTNQGNPISDAEFLSNRMLIDLHLVPR
jgi:FkbM family methyltransferase